MAGGWSETQWEPGFPRSQEAATTAPESPCLDKPQETLTLYFTRCSELFQVKIVTKINSHNETMKGTLFIFITATRKRFTRQISSCNKVVII